MKTIIAGSRDITSYSLVKQAVIDSGFTITEVVSGSQKTRDAQGKIVGGVDYLGEIWAHNMGIPVKSFPAQWSELGKAAGPVRNAEMAEYAEALICIHTGGNGSASMLRLARARGLKIYEVNLTKKATSE